MPKNHLLENEFADNLLLDPFVAKTMIFKSNISEKLDKEEGLFIIKCREISIHITGKFRQIYVSAIFPSCLFARTR